MKCALGGRRAAVLVVVLLTTENAARADDNSQGQQPLQGIDLGASEFGFVVGMNSRQVLLVDNAPPLPDNTMNPHTFVWDRANGLKDIFPDPTYVVLPSGINAAGEVAGTLVADGASGGAFVWTAQGGIRLLPPLPDDTDSGASFINDLGEVAGTSTRPGPDGPVSRNVVWDSQGVPRLSSSDPTRSGADYFMTGFSNSDLVAGVYNFDPDNSIQHAFVIGRDGSFSDLNPFGAAFSKADDVSGFCVGGHYLDANWNTGAFVSFGGHATDLGPIAPFSTVQVNPWCDAVGTFSPDGVSSHAFLARTIGGAFIDLTPAGRIPKLVSSSVPTGTPGARSINQRGDVALNVLTRRAPGFFGLVSTGYVWSGGALTPLPPIRGDVHSFAVVINDLGWVAGQTGNSPFMQAPLRAVLWVPQSQ
jgi:hypothetical protein